jgi:tight adherence protein B
VDTEAFDRQFGDLMFIVMTALRSGYSLRQTLETVATYAPEPTAGVLKQWLSDLEAGNSYDEAFAHLLEACPSPYLSQFVDTVKHHQEVGGNLALMIDEVGERARREVDSDRTLFPHILALCEQVAARVPDYVRAEQA